MLIHPWDAAVDTTEWREWLATTDRFGVLAVNNVDADEAPVVVPTHFTIAEDELLVHLARPNPAWPHLEAARRVRLVVTGDYAFIPGYWRARAGDPSEDGVPTSYYASVQFVCRPTIVDDPQDKAEILSAQLADFQPEGHYADVVPGEGRYGRMLPGIRGLRLAVERVDAKFKYDDHNPTDHRERITASLEDRASGLDASAAAQQRRRLGLIGEWRSGRSEA
ncbi:FMN-binding negative transcriptional regulator [Nocardioides albidus]|uniref:FMN-binding negative transcriptional regulator n=1 Tax=Nocardioides albidus TaxID=1517589 RepID=A0A5C4VX53_9ACTN|nr:FMN-binding negative transcriptional regulator [Nocardioides albidus]TNM39779.1 FMN-binding negative transcriptional regulator [Nocardioides albidus]